MEFPELAEAVMQGDAALAEELARAALGRGADVAGILDRTLVPTMDVVGERFSQGEIYVPEMLLAARAMQAAVGVLEPLLAQERHASRGKIVIGTVKGDVHDIGKNIVVIMLRGAGFEVHDLGVDVAPERFVQAVVEHEPDILGLSALITTTMPMMKTVIGALESAGVRDSVKVMVGGAPVTEEYAREIGANGYGRDAAAAAEEARELVAGR